METDRQIILQTQNLTKRYGKRWAVNGIDLTIYRGDIFGFLGPNGAGKSTTIRMIVGLISPTEGEIYINNMPYSQRTSKLTNKIRALIEEPNFYEYLSGYENLKILAQLSGVKEKNLIEESLRKVNLFSRRNDKVSSYSQGMKQRLGIAQAIFDKPDLIILDEPTNGLDPQGIKEVRELIQQLNSNDNITFLISSHILQEIENSCNRIAILNQGNLLSQGRLDKLLKDSTLEDYFISLINRKQKIS